LNPIEKDQIMKYVFSLALAICLASSSTAIAQGGFWDQLGNRLGQQGREVLQQELRGMPSIPDLYYRGPQSGQPQEGYPQYQQRSLPSEPGQRSGGNQPFLPGDGGFGLPGNGQPRPGNGQPGFQPNPGYQPYRPYQPQPGGTYVQPSPVMPSSPVSSSQYILIRCPQSTQGTVSYTLSSNGSNYGFSMSGGQEQHFRAGSVWSISYFNGSKQKRHQLESGRVYMIKRDANNLWQLYVTK
jgi:hypothetical protein